MLELKEEYISYLEGISHLINLKSRIFIITKKIWLLNDRRILTNKKTKKIIKRVIKESNLKKSELKKANIISYLNSVFAGYFTDYFCYINWENNTFVHHDCVFENVYKEILAHTDTAAQLIYCKKCKQRHHGRKNPCIGKHQCRYEKRETNNCGDNTFLHDYTPPNLLLRL